MMPLFDLGSSRPNQPTQLKHLKHVQTSTHNISGERCHSRRRRHVMLIKRHGTLSASTQPSRARGRVLSLNRALVERHHVGPLSWPKHTNPTLLSSFVIHLLRSHHRHHFAPPACLLVFHSKASGKIRLTNQILCSNRGCIRRRDETDGHLSWLHDAIVRAMGVPCSRPSIRP